MKSSRNRKDQGLELYGLIVPMLPMSMSLSCRSFVFFPSFLLCISPLYGCPIPKGRKDKRMDGPKEGRNERREAKQPRAMVKNPSFEKEK